MSAMPDKALDIASAGAGSGSPPNVALASALTAISGLTDAVGYAALGHLFLSFMSGNSTHFGTSLAGMDWPDAALAGAVIATYVAGSALGTWIGDRAGGRRKPVVLGTELLILCAALGLTLLGAGGVALVPVAGAMGMQNTLHQIVAGTDVGKGFLTGNLFALGQSLARLGREPDETRRAVLNGLSWLAFIAGVVAGALIYGRFGLEVALLAIVIAVGGLLLADALKRLRRRSRHSRPPGNA
jgi:uncharacterized membrane protein YoaK (UPF0700 family)